MHKMSKIVYNLDERNAYTAEKSPKQVLNSAKDLNIQVLGWRNYKITNLIYFFKSTLKVVSNCKVSMDEYVQK